MLTLNYEAIKRTDLKGRYITATDIDPFLKLLTPEFDVRKVGESVQGRPIKCISLGTGPIRIMMWSQMHGNESTTTKSVLDLINYVRTGSDMAQLILSNCTIAIIPILNPDGAAAYTRANANGVDLNRDAQDRTQPESVALRELYDRFKPDYCFNLHDQRTIFNVGDTDKPATVSFLAPAHDAQRSISRTRGISMQLIVAMDHEIQKYIPGQVGRFDDSFNKHCIGDTFQMLQTPTVLFEAGHFQGDYQRERTRYYIFIALLRGIEVIAKNEIDLFIRERYFDIPENNKLFFDVLIKNIHLLDPSRTPGHSAGILFVETLMDHKIDFVGKLEEVGDLDHRFAHKTYNCLDVKDLEILKNNKDLLKALK